MCELAGVGKEVERDKGGVSARLECELECEWRDRR